MSNPDRDQTNQLGPPDLPEVTRLNRNVLLVAAMGVGVVILAVTHVARSDTRAPARQVQSPVEAGAMASFLREPLSASGGDVPVPPPAFPELAREAVGASGSGGGTAAHGSAAGAFGAGPYDLYAAAPGEPELSPREEAYRRALRAALRVGDQAPGRERSSMHYAAWTADDLSGELAEYASGPSPGFASYGPDQYAGLEAAISAVTSGVPGYGPGPGAAPAPAPAAAKGAQETGDRYQAFLAAAADDQPPTYIASRLEEPISPYQIMAGTLLPAMLVTGINSDLPGDILAQITRNVYDSQQRFLLIPRGTKVIGRYDDQIALGQSRVLIAWTRLILPDGRSLSLPGLPTKDLRGASGLRDKVDNHYGRLYGQATLLSIVGAGAQLSQPQQGSVFAPPSAGQVAAGALGRELSSVSMETIRRNMDVRPTLQVRPGMPFYIFLERDIVLEGPYADAG